MPQRTTKVVKYASLTSIPSVRRAPALRSLRSKLRDISSPTEAIPELRVHLPTLPGAGSRRRPPIGAASKPPTSSDGVPLEVAVNELRAQLEALRKDDGFFILKGAELELLASLEKSTTTKGGLSWFVFSADAGTASSSSALHRIKLQLEIAEPSNQRIGKNKPDAP